jgi:polypeptide N-acetylgalactosaminyltransferase
MKGSKYSNLVYYRNNKRVGLIHSRILGSTLARGSYLMFMDAHCNPELGWEMALLEALKKCDDRAITAHYNNVDPVS